MNANKTVKNQAFWFVQCIHNENFPRTFLQGNNYVMDDTYMSKKEQNVFTSFWTTLYLGGTDKAGDGSNEGCPRWMHQEQRLNQWELA